MRIVGRAPSEYNLRLQNHHHQYLNNSEKSCIQNDESPEQGLFFSRSVLSHPATTSITSVYSSQIGVMLREA